MPHISPENISAGLQGNLETLRAGQAQKPEIAPGLQNSTLAEHKFAGRTQQQDRRVLHRRKIKAARLAEAGTAGHMPPPQQGRGK